MSQGAGPDPAWDETLEQAIAWAVKLGSGSASAEQHRACAAWREARPANAQAWAQVQALEQEFSALPPAPPQMAYASLTAAAPARVRRRRALSGLLGLAGLASGIGLGGALAWRLAPGQWQGEHSSAAGRRERIALPDGSLLHLHPGSQASVHFTPLRRLITLRQGELHLDCGADTGALGGRRPLWVHTPQARLEARLEDPGSRFGVRLLDDPARSLLQLGAGRVAIHRAGALPLVAQPGERLQFDANPASPLLRLTAARLDPEGWTQGQLIARQLPLAELLAELARWRGAPLRCAPEVADLQVSGVFQLDGPDAVPRALAVLARTLALRITPEPGGALSVQAAR